MLSDRSCLHQLDFQLILVTANHSPFTQPLQTLRPDIVWWDDASKKLRMVELTVPFETGFQAAAERKETNYEDLVNRAWQAGYNAHLITVEVGARGVPHMAGFRKLKQEVGLNQTELSSLLASVSQKVIEGYFQIWCTGLQ